MKTFVPKLSIKRNTLVTTPKFTRITPIIKIPTQKATHLPFSRLFSNVPRNISTGNEDIDTNVLRHFDGPSGKVVYDPNNVVFIQFNDIETSKQQLFSIFNRAGKLSPTDPNPVVRVKMFAQQSTATILFKDPRSVDLIMQKNININGKPVQLSRHKLVDYKKMMEPSKTRVLFQLSPHSQPTQDKMQQFFLQRIEDLGKVFPVKPFVNFIVYKNRGVMEFQTEADAENAFRVLCNGTYYEGMPIQFSHVKPKEATEAEIRHQILAKEDELTEIFKTSNDSTKAIRLMEELKELGHNFKNSNSWLQFKMMKQAKTIGHKDLLRTLLEDITPSLYENTPFQNVIASVILGWAYLNEPQKVQEGIELLKKHYTELSTQTYALLIDAYSHIGHLEKLLKLYEYLKEQNMITPQIISCVLNYYSRQSDVDSIVKVIEEAQANPAHNRIVSFHYVILIHTIIKAKQLEKIPLVIAHMKQNNVPVDYTVNTALLKMYASTGNITSALRYFEEMKIQGWIPEIIHYHSVILAHKNAKFFDGQMKWFRRLLDDGLIPNNGVMMTMLSSAMTAGREQELEEILNVLNMNPALQNSENIIKIVKKWHRCKRTGEPFVDLHRTEHTTKEDDLEEVLEQQKQQHNLEKHVQDVQ